MRGEDRASSCWNLGSFDQKIIPARDSHIAFSRESERGKRDYMDRIDNRIRESLRTDGKSS